MTIDEGNLNRTIEVEERTMIGYMLSLFGNSDQLEEFGMIHLRCSINGHDIYSYRRELCEHQPLDGATD